MTPLSRDAANKKNDVAVESKNRFKAMEEEEEVEDEREHTEKKDHAVVIEKTLNGQLGVEENKAKLNQRQRKMRWEAKRGVRESERGSRAKVGPADVRAVRVVEETDSKVAPIGSGMPISVRAGAASRDRLMSGEKSTGNSLTPARSMEVEHGKGGLTPEARRRVGTGRLLRRSFSKRRPNETRPAQATKRAHTFEEEVTADETPSMADADTEDEKKPTPQPEGGQEDPRHAEQWVPEHRFTVSVCGRSLPAMNIE